jgi:catabolite regulation protein CreA
MRACRTRTVTAVANSELCYLTRDMMAGEDNQRNKETNQENTSVEYRQTGEALLKDLDFIMTSSGSDRQQRTELTVNTTCVRRYCFGSYCD